MILINLWLDINCQVTTKRATVPKPELFHQLNTPLLLLLLFSPSWNLYADFFPCRWDWNFICFAGYVRKITFREDIQKIDELDNGKPP